MEALNDLSIFLAYNANVDVIKHIGEDFEENYTGEQVREAKNRNPEKLSDRVDLLAAIFNCMRKGIGDEILIKTEEFKGWLEEEITPDEKRMGGQAGIMSNLLSMLGCRTVVFTPVLSKEQSRFFEKNENLLYPVVEDDELELKHPEECWKEIETKKNWIFEFFDDQELFGVAAESNSRFIASSEHELDNLEIGELENRLDDLVSSQDCMILSGYHNLKRKYGDGSTWREHLESAKDFIRSSKEINPDLKIQIEFAASHQKEIREATLEEVVPLADVISFDLNELDFIMDDLGIDEDVPDPESPGRLNEVLKSIIEELNIEAASIHTHHYFMSVSRDYVDSEPIKKGFEFARNVVWTGASGADINLENTKEAEKVNPSERGFELRNRLGEFLGSEEMKERGIHRGEFDTVVVPNKIFENPRLSVGLGDLISASSFALENALR